MTAERLTRPLFRRRETAIPFKELHSREYLGHKKKVKCERDVLREIRRFGCGVSGRAGGKCSQQAELSGENINISYKPDGTHVAVGNRVNEIAWNMSGEMFFLTTGNGKVEVLAYPSLRPIDTLMAYTAGCYCIAIDPVGRYFAVGSADSLVSLSEISEMLCVRTLTKLGWPVRTISFNCTGEYIASASEDLFIDIGAFRSKKRRVLFERDRAS